MKINSEIKNTINCNLDLFVFYQQLYFMSLLDYIYDLPLNYSIYIEKINDNHEISYFTNCLNENYNYITSGLDTDMNKNDTVNNYRQLKKIQDNEILQHVYVPMSEETVMRVTNKIEYFSAYTYTYMPMMIKRIKKYKYDLFSLKSFLDQIGLKLYTYQGIIDYQNEFDDPYSESHIKIMIMDLICDGLSKYLNFPCFKIDDININVNVSEDIQEINNFYDQLDYYNHLLKKGE